MKNVTAIICSVLAQHAGLHPSAVHPRHHLERDLDVTPLELALIRLELEDAVGVELPSDGFASLETVDDLFAFVAHAVGKDHHDQRLDRVA